MFEPGGERSELTGKGVIMIVEGLLERFHIHSMFLKLIIGSALVALLIVLGIVVILDLLGISIEPTLPAVFATIGAALFAARMRALDRTKQP